MIKAILFDLDNTLLGNDMDTFMPAYFERISTCVADLMAPDAFMRAILLGSRAVIANSVPTLTNEALFWKTFEDRSGVRRATLRDRLARFYAEEFPALRQFTRQRPAAPDVIAFCEQQGLQIVIATNPLFPRSAIEQRLAWAGLPVDDHDFALVTAQENMHAAKPSLAYYREIVERLGIAPREALMVGDDWDNDIMPANRQKIWTFWVAGDDVPAPAPLQATSRGTLAKLFSCLQSGWLDSFALMDHAHS